MKSATPHPAFGHLLPKGEGNVQGSPKPPKRKSRVVAHSPDRAGVATVPGWQTWAGRETGRQHVVSCKRPALRGKPKPWPMVVIDYDELFYASSSISRGHC